MSTEYEFTVDLRKGEGRQGILRKLDWALCTSGVRFGPGRYVVTVHRAGPAAVPDEARKRAANPKASGLPAEGTDTVSWFAIGVTSTTAGDKPYGRTCTLCHGGGLDPADLRRVCPTCNGAGFTT